MAGDPTPFLRAAKRYGSEPSFDKWSRAKYGVSGPALLAKVAKGESGFDMHAVSSAGARGGTQFMPGTRADFIRRYGVDAWKDPDAAVHATKLYLQHDPRGVAGYNPGMPTYASYILGQKVGDIGGGTSGSRAPASPRTPAKSGGGTGDTSAARGAAIAQFVTEKNSDPVDFALTLKQLQAAAGQQSAAPSSGGARRGAPSRTIRTGGIPVGRRGKVIGTPHAGTHTLGNWQSDNAVDIGVPAGTPMVALQDGVVVKVRQHPQDGGRFAGDQITVRGANGNEYFYAHGVAGVKPGQRIRKGQVLGRTGSANGVEHLHFGQMRGDPRQHT